ncbi:MAG: type II secretion system protein [Desulfamplus sp.]|nr:type II secretion system protein [Desulfamplus sp.]
MKKTGYTLFEVMVALIILSIAITSVTGALSTAKGLSGRADYAMDSIRMLKNILNNPELMKQIVESQNFQKALEDEEGWICKAQTQPLIIDSADLLWENTVDSGKRGVNNKKKIVGQEIEVQGVVEITLCVTAPDKSEKEYCISRWKRVDGSTPTYTTTTPIKKDDKRDERKK